MDATPRTLQGGDGMNHDYAHCMDYRNDCPKECFRARLVRDLYKQAQCFPIYDIPISWMHFKGTDECKRKEVTE